MLARWMGVMAALALPACGGPLDGADPGVYGEESVNARVHAISTISYAPNSFVIGNAYPGWTDLIQGPPQFSSGPGNPNGASYRWGYLFGESFDRCAWLNDDDVSATTSHHGSNRCGRPQEIDTPYFFATYTNGMHNELAGDGSITHMHYAGSGCVDRRGYGNVAPWRVPATPASSRGEIADGAELRWRYVSRDGEWVLVREPQAPPGVPNWFFVHRGCVSLANVN
jgi:hypothetical protein